MPSRTILLKTINNGIHKKSCGFPQLFLRGKEDKENKVYTYFTKEGKLTFSQTYSQAVDNFEMRIPNVDNQRQRERCLLEIYTKICE